MVTHSIAASDTGILRRLRSSCSLWFNSFRRRNFSSAMLCFLLLPASLVLTSYGADIVVVVDDYQATNLGSFEIVVLYVYRVVCLWWIRTRMRSPSCEAQTQCDRFVVVEGGCQRFSNREALYSTVSRFGPQLPSKCSLLDENHRTYRIAGSGVI